LQFNPRLPLIIWKSISRPRGRFRLAAVIPESSASLSTTQ
jgi:hypothetical protein